MVEQAELHIWERFLEGDERALTDIYKKYADNLYSYGVKISGNEALVKDCIQEIFMHLIENKKKLIIGPNIHLYLFKSLRNKLLDEIRSNTRKQEILNTKSKFEEDYSVPVEKEIIQNESQLQVKEKLKRILNELSNKQREIIYLRFTESLNYDEISTVLGIDKASARTLLYRTLKLIKEHINKNGFVLFLLSKVCPR